MHADLNRTFAGGDAALAGTGLSQRGMKPASVSEFGRSIQLIFIAGVALLAISLHLVLRFAFHVGRPEVDLPLLVALAVGGVPLVYGIIRKLLKREFGSDFLAAISIVTSVWLGEYLAGAIVVLMLSGGELLENYAVRNASSVLRALAKRMPSIAHRKRDQKLEDVALDQVQVGDTLVIYPHDICPVDGTVTEGHGVMDESYLTGEPFEMSKAPGSTIISGSINGETALTIVATKKAVDSRYARIMAVMRESEKNQPKLRRLGDILGGWYTPVALVLAIAAWIMSGEPRRFLSVLVVATPCPLLIAIPVAIIGSISLAARRAIIIKNPIALEQIDQCRTAIFDKTGTLTYGEPRLTEARVAKGFTEGDVLGLAASLERYSKHPLARAILSAARDLKIEPKEALEISEPPGKGLRGTVGAKSVEITSRSKVIERDLPGIAQIPPISGGLECVVVIDGQYAATLKFRDAPRSESVSFVGHLGPRHGFDRIMIVSGDRESEVRYLAEEVGVNEVYAQKSPEEKLEIVRKETSKAKTLYVGDGINDAPAMMAATIGMAIGQNSDVTSEAASVVALENSLKKSTNSCTSAVGCGPSPSRAQLAECSLALSACFSPRRAFSPPLWAPSARKSSMCSPF
jgi:heavy metal translocating P-type ATPase